MNKIVISEWDGDRGMAAGGFAVKLITCHNTVSTPIGHYDTGKEREEVLLRAREWAHGLAEELELDVFEELFL